MTICPHCHGTGVLPPIDSAAVVKAIYDYIGDSPFTVRELFARLREAPALDDALRDLTRPRLGKLLRKACGQDSAGFRVQRISAERGAAIWQIVGVR